MRISESRARSNCNALDPDENSGCAEIADGCERGTRKMEKQTKRKSERGRERWDQQRTTASWPRKSDNSSALQKCTVRRALCD
ncbi:unnamed protein product [Lasius platythorax]|uniref:Uncharacterized protein n=1 Tax=Lasius platythorax TaxID=488582 RepID=A0AAV2P0D9_9HYME